MDEHRNASKTAITKKRQIEKLKTASNIKPDRADEALDEFEDARKHETTLSQKLTAVSQKLAPSLTSHTKQMHEDLFTAFTQHAKAGLAYEKQVLKDLEALKHDIKAIPSGKIFPSAGATHAKDASYYIHAPAPASPVKSSQPSPVTSSPVSPVPSPTHSRTASLSSQFSGSQPQWPTFNQDVPPSRKQTEAESRINNDGTQSLYIPPTHQPSSSNARNDLSKSVLLPGTKINGTIRSTHIEDPRHRVDAKLAASKLANMF